MIVQAMKKVIINYNNMKKILLYYNKMPRNNNKNSPKQGGNLSKQVSDLLVPFGLILAKESLEKFLKQDGKNKSTKKSASARSGKKVSLSGGNKSCGRVSSSNASVEPFTKATSTKYASVGGKRVKK